MVRQKQSSRGIGYFSMSLVTWLLVVLSTSCGKPADETAKTEVTGAASEAQSAIGDCKLLSPIALKGRDLMKEKLVLTQVKVDQPIESNSFDSSEGIECELFQIKNMTRLGVRLIDLHKGDKGEVVRGLGIGFSNGYNGNFAFSGEETLKDGIKTYSTAVSESTWALSTSKTSEKASDKSTEPKTELKVVVAQDSITAIQLVYPVYIRSSEGFGVYANRNNTVCIRSAE